MFEIVSANGKKLQLHNNNQHTAVITIISSNYNKKFKLMLMKHTKA